MSLFEKAALITDIHFGEKQDSEEHNQDCLDFLEWFRDRTIEHHCDCIIFLGDYHHNRVRTENRTGWYSRMGVELLNNIGLPIYWLIGNHELYLKDSRDIHSLQYMNRYPNIHLINEITQLGEVVFSPWLVGNEHEDLLKLKCRYIFGHFELPFFLMNQVIEKTYDGKGLHTNDFENCRAVYSGHFHSQQVRLNSHKIPVHYIGNCFGHNFNDVNDPERGMALLKWGETMPEYLSWPDAPVYLRFKMSEFIKKLEDNTSFCPRSTIEIIDDMDTSTEALEGLRDFIKVRQVRFKKTVIEPIIDTTVNTVQYASLDDMIESKLKTMNYDGKFDPEILIRLYRES